uniref:PIMRE protein n=1 Tax=Nothoprocta perdicaria TaxID=30464 RepID=A0A8C6Z5X0_NOTPE
MVSVLQNVKTTMGWRKHQLLADINENESPVPDKFKRRAPLSSLNTICMCLRKRIPLKEVQLNFHETPTWESLEGKDKYQTLQSIRKTAKNTFGTVSQVFCLCTTSFKKKGTSPQTPCHNNSVTPAASSKGTPRSSKRALFGPRKVTRLREWRSFSCWLGKDAVPLRRSGRAVALKSPYSSLCQQKDVCYAFVIFTAFFLLH